MRNLVLDVRNFDSIKEVVAETFSAHLKVRILDVRVEDDLDSDGGDVLRIRVIFDGQPEDLDGRKLSSAIRLLRPKLEEIDEPALPLLSFISNTDAHNRRKRAAG
jgi:hypothetical protein